MFFSIRPEECEASFWDEIWGCIEYIKIPYDTLMDMPVRNRKILIAKHNHQVEEQEKGKKEDLGSGISGDAINGYAAIEQAKEANGYHGA
jgi:hypothetical protein